LPFLQALLCLPPRREVKNRCGCEDGQILTYFFAKVNIAFSPAVVNRFLKAIHAPG
jgi:hypothetical protein